MTKGMGNFTGVFAMSKGNTESTSGQTVVSGKTTAGTANYLDNILNKALYKTPLNPLITRGTMGEAFANFTAATADATINSYEIHKADNTVLTNAVNGINQSNSSTQTYSAVNRIYPNSTTVSDHLSNLEQTRGNTIKIYDYSTNVGQSFVNLRTTTNGGITSSASQIVVDSVTNLAVGDVIIIGDEQMFITAINSSTLDVIRGYNNSNAAVHADETKVYEIDNIDHLWVLVYSDDENKHHFAKITEILQDDVFGDKIQFEPSLGVDIPKDTKFAIFSSLDSNLPKIDSDNQTLVACAYGLQATDSSIRHHINTHVSRPFFFFLNGKDRLEPATRYILRSSSWNGSNHTYTYSTFVTDQEHEAHIVDYGPFTMEATLVDMMYKADNPAAMNYHRDVSDNLALNNGTPDTITISTDGSFDNSISDLDGSEGTNWGITGILRDTRIAIRGSSSNDDIYCIDSATDSTATTITMDAGDFGSSETTNNLEFVILGSSVDLDHNKIYSAVDSTNHFKNSFRMANRTTDDALYSTKTGYSRYLHYCDSPLTNTIIPNAMEMIEYESVTSTGGYVDIVFADTQKILAKKIKEGDSILINHIVENELVGKERIFPIGDVEYSESVTGANTILASNLGNEKDMRFLLSSVIPNSSTSTGSRYDPLHDSITTNIDGTLYHFNIDTIAKKASGTNNGTTQAMSIRSWRKATDTEYVLTSATAMTTVPNFNTTAFRRKYSFLADNLLTTIPIDSKLTNYILDGNFATVGTNWNRNVRDFKTMTETLNPTNNNLTGTGANTRPSLNVGEVQLEKASHSRNNDIHLVLKGGQITGHRIKVEYGDKHNNFLKLKTHLKDERFLENFNRTDVTPYLNKLSNVSLYSYPINPDNDSGGNARYDLARSNTATNHHARGVVSYLDYFSGSIDIEKTVFKGTVESVEQVIEDGMFKLKIRGRTHVSDLLGPIVNKDFKFTEDIIYSTVGPVERMAHLSQITQTVQKTVYEVGATTIQIEDITFANNTLASSNGGPIADSTLQKGDLLYNSSGVFLGRVFNIVASGSAFDITFEEGIPTRIKDGEHIFVSGSNQLENITPLTIPNESETTTFDELVSRGNMISFSKAMSANPYSSTRVNSLLGASNKGVIFTGGNNLSLSTTNAPSIEGTSLVGTSASNHPLAKGYSIANIGKIDYDLPFYCHFADEITGTNTIDYVNLHTVNSLTEYDIISLNSKETETVIEIAPICPAVLARVDNNPIDNRDKILVTLTGSCRENYAIGYNGPIEFTTWIEELNLGDYIFNSNGELYGQIIDISVGSTGTGTTQAILEGDVISITLDRPLFEAVTTSTTLHKYFTSSDSPTYYSGSDIDFASPTSSDYLSGTTFETSALLPSSSSATAAIAFLRKLKPNMLIKIETTSHMDNAGVFAITHVFEEPTTNLPHIMFNPRRHETGSVSDDGDSAFVNDTSATVRISVLTNYYTQSLYFLNTQGLTQGGTLTLTNNYLSSPNAVDNICKPIKWSGGLFHFITDSTITADDSNGAGYNPNASAPVIFSDMIDRYGNTKWRYFGLQKGKYLSYINRRRKDGQIKDTYTTEKGRVNGYATAYRIADAKRGHLDVSAYPYAYHNNDFSWNVLFYDPNIGSTSSVSVYDSTNGIKRPSYFLQYLSPESRDFRPVMGSNFADFDKHGTYVTSPEHADHRVLSFPRFMPRIHDNFGGGDWQEDMEAPLNNIDESIIYKKFSATNEVTDNGDTDFRFKLDRDTATGNNWDINYEADSDTRTFPVAISNRWIKLSNYGDRVINRAFKLGASGSGRADIDDQQPPYTHWDNSSNSTIMAVGKLTGDIVSSGYEELTILYPPHIGPKFDGITRAKDHWELPDPKTMRWHIFSPADMYPDSMSRKHHIGYSGTVDSSSISRSFTDYNIMLRGQGTFTQSDALHDLYEGSLQEEIETDDQYATLPITTASISPSEIKRFGLMRLIDCTYDWHFNLIDPERLPSDMTQLTTPNFEYTRFQPLRRIDARITGYDSSGDVITTNVSDITTHLEQGDQIFTDEGRYIGKVASLSNASSASTINLQGSHVKKNIFKSDGTKGQYFGFVHVCGDGTTGIHDRESSDSFYQFTTKGRGGTNTFTDVSEIHKINMLQSMYSASLINTAGANEQVPYGVITGTADMSASYSTGSTITVTSGSGYAIGQGIMGNNLAHGTVITNVVGTTLTVSPTPTGSNSSNGILRLELGEGFPVNYLTNAVNTNVRDSNITESKFLINFNRNFSAMNHSASLVLPPAFRTFYSERLELGAVTTGKYDLHRTINAMASKEDLVIDDDAVGVAVNNRATEYAHVSNVLEWMQKGGNPYSDCDVVFLNSYTVENSITKPIIGGKINITGAGTENFPYSKSKNTSLADTSAAKNGIKYGSGNAPSASFKDAGSGEYSFLAIRGNQEYAGYASKNSDSTSSFEDPFFDSEFSSYVAAGIYSAFVPHLNLQGITHADTFPFNPQSNVIADGDVDGETQQGIITFDSINGSNSKEGMLKIVTRPYNDDANNIDYAYNHFLNFVDLTGMYLVGNFGFNVGDNPASGNYDSNTNKTYDLLDGYPFDNTATHAPQLLTLTGHSFNKPIENPILGRSTGFGNHFALGSSQNMMTVPDHIIYIKEHRRNITGKEVSHELLLDNIPLDKTGVPRFHTQYKIMRPAEHCLWANSPNEIDMYKLSAQTTKMPKGDNMYDYIPSMNRVNNQGDFTGFDTRSTSLATSSRYGENEAVMSMYVAVDMDARHSQQKQLTQTATINIGENVVTFNSSVANDIQVGDKLKLGNQKCYVKSISANGLEVTIAGRFASNANLSGATVHLLNNTFTVLRDYIHLFNPTGNRNTFKSGEAYNMLITDGVNKQKISMGVEADYYHDRALCKLSIGKIENSLLGLVSFGEIFTITSNVPVNLENVVSAKIGSTVTIGEEVEDIVNNILSNEGISYDITDNKEYPYYLSPNFQGIDLFNATNFAAKYKEKEIRVDENGISLIKQSNDLDFRDITLSYENKDLKIISVTRNKSTFDLYNEIIVYGNGVKSIKRNRKSIDKSGKKTLEEVNMELVSQDDVDNRAKGLLKAHSEGDDRFTVKMSTTGIEFIKAGDIVTLDFPTEGVPKDTYKIYEIRRELKGLIELEVGTYRKDLANRFAELAMLNKSNAASIRGSQFTSTTAPLDFFDTVKLKELSLVIRRTGLADPTAFTLGFQTLSERKLDFGATMSPQETVTEIIREEDLA